jgi:hypothetical protein
VIVGVLLSSIGMFAYLALSFCGSIYVSSKESGSLSEGRRNILMVLSVLLGATVLFTAPVILTALVPLLGLIMIWRLRGGKPFRKTPALESEQVSHRGRWLKFANLMSRLNTPSANRAVLLAALTMAFFTFAVAAPPPLPAEKFIMSGRPSVSAYVLAKEGNIYTVLTLTSVQVEYLVNPKQIYFCDPNLSASLVPVPVLFSNSLNLYKSCGK